MATQTRTRSRQSKNGDTNRKGGSTSGTTAQGSAFRWSGRQAGMIAAAAVAGAAVGAAANLGRKLMVQGLTSNGNWDEALAAEHRMVLGIFDKIEATADDQTFIRAHLLVQLKHALVKHAAEEENVIYPALREADDAHDADALNGEHGYVKTFLYELEKMSKDSPGWIAKIREFRALLEEHIQMEEKEVFPRLKQSMSEAQNATLTAAMNKEGFAMA